MKRVETNDFGFTRPSMTYEGSEITGEQLEWAKACEAYQKQHNRKFMRHTDYLRVALLLGYRRVREEGDG